jgi:hypothetical protein
MNRSKEKKKDQNKKGKASDGKGGDMIVSNTVDAIPSRGWR